MKCFNFFLSFDILQPPEVFLEKALLKKITTFTEKHLCLGHFLIKFQVRWLPILSKREVFLRILGHSKEGLYAKDGFYRQF